MNKKVFTYFFLSVSIFLAFFVFVAIYKKLTDFFYQYFLFVHLFVHLFIWKKQNNIYCWSYRLRLLWRQNPQPNCQPSKLGAQPESHGQIRTSSTSSFQNVPLIEHLIGSSADGTADKLHQKGCSPAAQSGERRHSWWRSYFSGNELVRPLKQCVH